jgi:hydrogenase maturation protein HypF
MESRVQILVRGIVQGVGFRPFVFSVAKRQALRGKVLNNSIGVLIDVEGDSRAIDLLIAEIKSNPPPLSLVESVERGGDLVLLNYSDFQIAESVSASNRFLPISADVATCQDCLRELFDHKDRRYRYPFINCTNCGPRFTIIEDIPYDRANTTMGEFAMCADCRSEYEDPRDRRFHAEPVACAACGPELYLSDSAGNRLQTAGDDLLELCQSLLGEGKIIAVKGLGGFHLACDALNPAAVEELRRRKYREDKPFALMTDSVDLVRQHCLVSEAEESLLLSAARPIVLLQRRPDSTAPRAVAPGVNTIGFMLAYTPLHHLLLQGLGRPLVMTSGNKSDEPICYENADAAGRLISIADYFLSHDRRIHIRTDDSVTRVLSGRPVVLRRSRGYAPAPIRTAVRFERDILACGAELKNTFCLAHQNYAFLSHHIGDLENFETLESFTKGIEHFKRLFNIYPEAVAYDLHPEYLSTKYALAQDDKLETLGVQHHHAHIASCMVDNGIEGEVIGVAMDGLGFGLDSRFWGGEFFVAGFDCAERVAHLDYIPMPGGAKAIRQPWRLAAVYLERVFGDKFLDIDLPFVRGLDRRTWNTLRKMSVTKTNSPETSSMGRLFDAIASIVGLRNTVNYEGQAAIELEAIAGSSTEHSYEFEISADGPVIEADPVIRRVVEDLLEGLPAEVVSARFHQGVAKLIVCIADRIRDERGIGRVALSGGVFQNALLSESASRLLDAAGFQVFTHSRVPPGDGGISLGQAAVANARLRTGRG